MEGQRLSIGRLHLEADIKLTQVAPADPAIKRHDSAAKRTLRDSRYQKLSFLQAFGALGIPIVLILVLCLAWTPWLVFVSLAPNQAANWLMNTGTYDNGQFWLIIDPDPKLTRAGAAGLVFVALCYLFVSLKMLFWREKDFTPAMVGWLEARLLNSWNVSRLDSRTWSVVLGQRYRRVHSTWKELTSFNGKKRKVWNVYTKSVDLTMQMIVLLRMLKHGSPVELVYGYAFFVATNSLSCAINILSDRFSVLTEILIDSIFDLSAAVLFPIATLLFSYHTFEFDREVYLTYLVKLGPGSFEHIARLFADQSEIALFRLSFDSLRFSSPLDLVVRIAMNLGFCYRIRRMMERGRSGCGSPIGITLRGGLLRISRAPKAYEEWAYPPDAYNSLKETSVSGKLESIQIINRQLLEFPEELHSCRNLKTIQLLYSSTQNVPDWVGKFSHLETLHIEGKLGSLNLQDLPDTLFNHMPNLAMIHLGVHESLERIPPLTGVPHLQSLSLAWMFKLHQLPSFDHIPDLRRLVIAVLPFLEWMPDMSPLQNLVDFTVMPGIMCCNGFVGGCDLTNYFCSGNPMFGMPPASCLVNNTNPSLPVTPYLGSTRTQAAFETFAPNVCNKWAPGAFYIDNTPTQEKIEMCDGKPFRECVLPGNVTGICYNMRFQVLSCINDDSRIALRRYQIEKGVGPSCDPVEEKWLGCGE
ncbi:10 kda heat shock protein [Phytophthora pseudosyringae]|uniref:10 kDa heat shock protein n=1 Tax=Phytophthora pseudosyringae TaxID=221518 RepID=A0A8T1VAQ8_9STRA|nr:10 kda heat shock protein [Phytophthora pseudosyringae]